MLLAWIGYERSAFGMTLDDDKATNRMYTRVNGWFQTASTLDVVERESCSFGLANSCFVPSVLGDDA